MVGNRTPDYAPPDPCLRLWKDFGTNTEAGKHLRALYSSAAQYNAYQSLKYPSIRAVRESPQLASKPKAVPKSRVRVLVPRVGGRRNGGLSTLHCRRGVKTKKQIEEELKKSEPLGLNLAPGRDLEAEKDHLAELNQFGGGYLGLPKVDTTLSAGTNRRDKRCLHHGKEERSCEDQERKEMLDELLTEVRVKQGRSFDLAREVEAESKLPVPPAGSQASRNRLKRMTAQQNELLQLQNDIERHLKDIAALSGAENATNT
ncbi:hypothetical protein FOL47_002827 [Perkinsus chesapeaki]|uniref:Uncharacterized protein n=1 Tax=Perkinsus chesapeaki TaxID=330153 RepID=A0A7J6MCG2_PERCH|nr:hypothetical protein FOL47_002827 [Perkinsus chesapeaki]